MTGFSSGNKSPHVHHQKRHKNGIPQSKCHAPRNVEQVLSPRRKHHRQHRKASSKHHDPNACNNAQGSILRQVWWGVVLIHAPHHTNSQCQHAASMRPASTQPHGPTHRSQRRHQVRLPHRRADEPATGRRRAPTGSQPRPAGPLLDHERSRAPDRLAQRAGIGVLRRPGARRDRVVREAGRSQRAQPQPVPASELLGRRPGPHRSGFHPRILSGRRPLERRTPKLYCDICDDASDTMIINLDERVICDCCWLNEQTPSAPRQVLHLV